jgi:hypothetical protein
VSLLEQETSVEEEDQLDQEEMLRVELEQVEASAEGAVLRMMPILFHHLTLRAVQEALGQVMEAIVAGAMRTFLEAAGQVLVVLFSSMMEEDSPYKEAAAQAGIT